MAGEVLNILQRHVLVEQVGHHRDPEAVRGKQVGQTGILERRLSIWRMECARYPAGVRSRRFGSAARDSASLSSWPAMPAASR